MDERKDFKMAANFQPAIVYHLKHELECFIRYKSEAKAKYFISDKARIASVLNGLKNDPSYKFIGEVLFKSNVAQAEKMKAKVYVSS